MRNSLTTELAHLLDLAITGGIRDLDLDDLVIELKSREATDLNNAGLDAQLAYLLEAHGGDVAAAWQAISGNPDPAGPLPTQEVPDAGILEGRGGLLPCRCRSEPCRP